MTNKPRDEQAPGQPEFWMNTVRRQRLYHFANTNAIYVFIKKNWCPHPVQFNTLLLIMY